MPAYKDKNGTWYVMVRYTDWTGAKKQKCQRGFETKREAQEWEAQFKLQKRADIDMTLESFYELYAEDLKPRLKEFTDATGICLLLVHHTRKQQADDKFEMISGTNGLMGAADGAFLLHKDKRVSSEAVLDISGRDQPDQTLYLNRDEETLVWNLDKAEMETFKPKPDPVIEAVAGFITDENPAWHGTATELVEALHLEISPNTLTMRLNINASRLLNEYGIQYANIRNHAGQFCSERKRAGIRRTHDHDF